MSIPVCRFYQSQSCKFGQNCRYLHPTSQRPPPELDCKESRDGSLSDPTCSVTALTSADQHLSRSINDQDEVTIAVRSTHRKVQSLQSQDSKEAAPENHGLPPLISERPVNKNICHYFHTFGNCRHGNDCRFLHSLSGGGSQSYRQHGPSRRPNHPRNVAEIPPRFRKIAEETVVSNRAVPESATAGGVVLEGVRHADIPARGQANGERGTSIAGTRVCPYFIRGHCNRGDYCRFVHEGDQPGRVGHHLTRHQWQKTPEANGEVDDRVDSSPGKVCVEVSVQNVTLQTEHTSKTTSSSILRPVIIKQKFSYTELDKIDILKVRDSEISTIKKRFPRDKISVVDETNEKFSARILFSPTDPDWAFDVRVFELLVTVPSDYPREVLKVQLPRDQNLPETVRRYIEVSIQEWLEDKVEQLAADRKVELMFRPFLLWLDRNIEDITMEALKQFKRELVAKAAGMEFIPAQKLQARLRTHSQHSYDDDDGGEAHSDDAVSDNVTSTGSDSDSEEEEEEGDDNSSDDVDDGEKLNIHPDKKGTEIELRNLQLKKNVSALLFEKLKLVVQCGRCKNHADILAIPGKDICMKCDKCSQIAFVHFRVALVHQFSSVAGYLDLEGCQVCDLIWQDCRVSVTCTSCSKQTRLDGLVSGHLIDGWCQACNARFQLATGTARFVSLGPSRVDTSKATVVAVGAGQHKRVVKDPAIREGWPLPEFGTCKHYKHSYRWLRFPCCGKAYPCDVCHDKKEDHEMVYATRMICGHCSKEQNFAANRPCTSCGENLTKVRTAHWEGGSGCRDKIFMSKSDQQKYKNMNKTLSNHQKKLQATTQKKKATKLRHA